MVAPAPTDNVRLSAGYASLEVQRVAGESTVTSSYATSPLKLLTPRSRGQSVWVYTSSFGGGLVAGDQTRLDLRLARGTRCFLGTQASTKIYRNPELRPCGHSTHARLAAGSLLIFAPDPVQAFAGSTYTQRQEFRLAADASLVLLDWFSSGRAARHERWAFSRFQSRNEVFVGDERVFLDSLLLHPEDGAVASAHRTGRFNCFASLLLLGPAVRSLADSLLADTAQQPVRRQSSLLCSASSVRDGAVLRLACEDVEGVRHELQRHLATLQDQLGDNPWARKW
jgi:urease accessory protein